jgi:hypothetical protein
MGATRSDTAFSRASRSPSALVWLKERFVVALKGFGRQGLESVAEFAGGAVEKIELFLIGFSFFQEG